MIEKVGLLNSGLEEMAATAWELYSNWEYDGQPAQEDISASIVEEFKRTFSSKNVEIHFMGLWDSVNSVGLITDRMFPYTTRSSIVKHVRHAVSIDERRGKYKQVLFKKFSYYPNIFSLDCACSDYDSGSTMSDCSSTPLLSARRNNFRSKLFRALFGEQKDSRRNDDPRSGDIVEIWFPGSHGDVGGGWPPDENGQYLSDVSLRWMLSEAILFGVKFKRGSIHEFHETHPIQASLLSCDHDMLSLRRTQRVLHTKDKTHSTILTQRLRESLNRTNNQRIESNESTPITIRAESGNFPEAPVIRFDSRGDESFFLTLAWWLIELLPVGIKIEDSNGKWNKVRVPNLGRHRKIPKESHIHWSVFYRMHYVADYNPHSLPKEIGRKFKQSLKPFRALFTKEDLRRVSDMTFESIKSDWESVLWHHIPDELAPLLQTCPDL